MRTIICTVTSLLILFLPAGCAPRRLTEGIGFAAARYGVRDAAALLVANRGHLRFDTTLRCDLEDAIAAAGLSEMKKQGTDVLQMADALAIQSACGEIDRMPGDGLAFLMDKYGATGDRAGPADRREQLKQAFETAARTAVGQDLNALRAADNLRKARRLLCDIRRHIKPAAGDQGKAARIVLGSALFLPAAVGAEIADREALQRQMVADFEHVAEYRPQNWQGVPSAAALEGADPASLALWYAPIFVQQVDSDADYAASEDRIGRIYLTGLPDQIKVHVDIREPVVYWTRLEAKVGNRPYGQLVYVVWYPSRPALSPNDPQAGRIDGVVVRITLDGHNRPAIYEFVRSCGCYHTLWVSEFVEAAARKQYGPPAREQRFSVQRTVPGRELFLPDLIRDDGAHPRRPTVFVTAGHHLLMAVKPSEEGLITGKVEAVYSYRLEPYETLTRLPLGDGVASMFGGDGLVHGAGRGEGWLLAPTGMLSAGQPRQLGTMKIRMDAYDYDDPRLLERSLRLPDDF